MPRDQNTRERNYAQTTLPSTRTDLTTLIRLYFATQTHNEETKKYLAMIAAAVSS
jgi:hypothetical protein